MTNTKPVAWTRNITMLEWRMSMRSLIRPQIRVEPNWVDAMIVSVVAATMVVNPISVT